MILFKIAGKYIDLQKDFDLALQYNNSCFAFEKMQLSRTTEFTIPSTPTNDKIFNYAGSAVSAGSEVRRAYTAEIWFDGGVIIGTLKVTTYTVGSGYSAIFVWGDLTPLQNAAKAGEIGSYLADRTENIQIKHANVGDASGSPFLVFEKYKNGVTDGNMLLSEVNLNPCFPLSYLVSFAATKQGLTVNKVPFETQINAIKLILAGVRKRPSTEAVTVTGTPNSAITVTGSYGDFLELVDLTYTWVEIGFFWDTYHTQVVKGFKAKQDIDLKFTSTANRLYLTGNSESEFLLGSNNSEPYFIAVGSSISLKKGQNFAILNSSNYLSTTGYGQKQWIDNFNFTLNSGVTFNVSDTNNETNIIDDYYYLADNLPKVTLTDMIKTTANLLHCGIDYDSATSTISYFDYNFDRSQAINLLGKVIDAKRVDRKYLDYAKKNKIIFRSESYVLESGKHSIDYAVDNIILQDQKTLYTVPFSEGNKDGAGNVVLSDFDLSKTPNKGIAKECTICLAPQVVGQTYLRHISEFESVFTVPKYLDAIIKNSTTVVMTIRIEMKDFLAIKNTDCFQYMGIYYALISANFKNNQAEFTLVKI